MKLDEFLKEVDGRESDIINYSGKEALEAVKRNGYALKYVDKSIFGEWKKIKI